MIKQILKRDGRVAGFNLEKVTNAVYKAMKACGRDDYKECERISRIVEAELEGHFINDVPSVEQIQDIVERVLMSNGYIRVAKQYILYRAERTKIREMNTVLMKTYEELTFAEAQDSDIKRDNANIDGDTAMGVMLKYGSEGAKEFYEKYILEPKHSEAHRDGDIHIHDLDFYTLTTTCCQIDLIKLFKNGFSTGHGYLREPNDIQSYAALACIAIQSNQNDQHGGQSVPNFDYGLAEGVAKTFVRLYNNAVINAADLLAENCSLKIEQLKEFTKNLYKEKQIRPALDKNEEYIKLEKQFLKEYISDGALVDKIQSYAYERAVKETDRATYQAMEALIHNLNTMHSRAGAQTPFSSINYGMDTSSEGRLVTKNVLLATEAGLGFGETAIFPIHIFRVKDGISLNEGDKNYDLFKLACRVSAKRLFPNFSFLDAPFNKAYYVEGRPETEVSYMGCRTRVLGNVYDADKEVSYGRGNLSFTSINLPRIAIKSAGNIDFFFEELERKMELVCDQLLHRFQIQSSKRVKNFPFLMGQGIWVDSDKLLPNDKIDKVLKHGTLSVGFIGLAETLVALTGKHHGETLESRNLGLEIIGFMRRYLDDKSKNMKLNFTLLATPAEGLSGRFIKIDKEKYGVIAGVTDKEYYTNGFHVPVYFDIGAYDKIKIEAPYHALTNAGHITYVELDGDMAQNVEAFERVIRAMHDEGIGYGSINHPVDRDPVCGYNGVIGDSCPGCQRTEDESPFKFERIRRITGYLVGNLDRFNNAKAAEERDRVKHGGV